MTINDATGAQSGANGYSFAADSMALEEEFGFPRTAGDAERERFGIRPGHRVLDVGCGTGSLLRFLEPILDGSGELVGVDRDPDLLAIAATETPGGDVDVRLVEGDALDLPFDDSAFDAVASQFLLCVLPEPRAALAEMTRVCRPGGTIGAICCFCKSGSKPKFHGVTDWDGRDRFESLHDRFTELNRTTIRNPRLGLPNGEDLAVWGDFQEVGLVDLRISGHMPTFAPGDTDWTDDEAETYLRRRERLDLGRLDRLTEDERDTLSEHGFSRQKQDELRELTAKHYHRLLSDTDTARSNMDVRVNPMVLLSGRVPASP